MTKPETKKDPAFLEYVYELNEGLEVNEALRTSLTKINDLDIEQLKRIGLKNLSRR